MKSKMNLVQWKRLLILSIFPSFTLFVFAPLEILSGIWADVWIDISHIIGLIMLMFVLCFLGVYLGEVACSTLFLRVRVYYEALIVGFTQVSYVQGDFLKTDFGSLDGEVIGPNIDWTELFQY